uniref:Uncharacterized protein n=1 Tax=Candidozyma auris TaxID=498019 RepID=A0A0L0NZ92_CANAR
MNDRSAWIIFYPLKCQNINLLLATQKGKDMILVRPATDNASATETSRYEHFAKDRTKQSGTYAANPRSQVM